jgi:hypothetical protein
MVVVITNNLNIREVDLRHVVYFVLGLAISRKKNYSAEDGIEDGTKSLFRRNSGCYPEQKTLILPVLSVAVAG